MGAPRALEYVFDGLDPASAERVSRGVHDVRVEIEAHHPRAAATLRDYLTYLEGPWPGEPVARLRFRMAPLAYERIAELSDHEPRGPTRPAAGFEIWRDGEVGCIRVIGGGFGKAYLAEERADLLIDPERGLNAFLVRDLVGSFLIEMLRRRGRFPMHSSAAALGDDGVIVVGPAGAGKTTLALGMLRAGLALATDDWILYEPGPDGVRAHPFIQSVSVPFDQMDDPSRYEVLAVHREEPLHKYIVSRSSLCPEAPRSFRPRLLVLAKRTASAVSEVRPASTGEAMGVALAQGALATADSRSAKAQMAALRALLSQVECVELRAGRDVGADPTVGGRLIRMHLEKAVERSLAHPRGEESAP